MRQEIVSQLLTVFEKYAVPEGKNHYRILYPEILVSQLFATSIQMLSEYCLIAVPESVSSEKIESLVKEKGFEIKVIEEDI